jgi:general transcription factor 3C polypeptide 3 (transcription factor C subunit 4)
LSEELGNSGQTNFCLQKAISADPEDVSLRREHAELNSEIGEYGKAAESYKQIFHLDPQNVEALLKATELYKQCGNYEDAIEMLENSLNTTDRSVRLRVVSLLTSTLIEVKEYTKALECIEKAQKDFDGSNLPLNLSVKAGICYLNLLQGPQLDKAMDMFSMLQPEHAQDHPHFFVDVGDAFFSFKHYDHALNYYMMLEKHGIYKNGVFYSNIARCCLALKDKLQAIEYFYRALPKLEDSIDARLTLATLLLEDDKSDGAISVLSPPNSLESRSDKISEENSQWWWENGKIKLKLSRIYKSKGLLQFTKLRFEQGKD